jgi:hypothetical protein
VDTGHLTLAFEGRDFLFHKTPLFSSQPYFKTNCLCDSRKNATKQGLKFTFLTLAENYRYDFFST